MTTFITQQDDITAAWLTETLGVEVADLAVERVGTGQMGACYALRPTYAYGADAPERLIAKLPSADAGSREFASGLDAYAREVRFYRDIAADIGVRTPRCYHADASDDGRLFVLLMEDLTPATECEQIAGCTPEQARIGVEQAAALHGSSWEDDRLRGIGWLSTGTALWKQFAANAEAIQQGLRARYGDQLEAEYLAVGDRLAAGGSARWVERVLEPRCLWHCDFRLDNMLFDAAGGEVPLAVVDWQSVTMAHGVIDASYFVGAALHVDQRRQHEEALIRHYHEALLDHGAADYDWDTCWEDYRINSVAGFIVAAVSSVSVEQTERGDQMFLTMLRRHGQQAIDHDALGLINA